MTDPMFAPIVDNGYGVYAPEFFWSQYPNVETWEASRSTVVSIRSPTGAPPASLEIALPSS